MPRVPSPDHPPRTASRRALVAGLGGVGIVAATSSWSGAAPVRRAGATPEIAVVGAGLAGLACAYRFTRHGVPCTVYEAHPERLGGRCWTSRGWADGQTAEHGGEFIDSAHHSIRGLAHELGLTLDDLRGLPDGHPRPRERYFLRGRRRTETAVYAGYHRLQVAADRDAGRIGRFTYDRAGRAARELDERSAGRAWVDAWVHDPFTHGSYVAFRPGQYTRYWGFMGKPEHRVHFAGEHTSMRALGFLEGAVSSGRRAAHEVLSSL